MWRSCTTEWAELRLHRTHSSHHSRLTTQQLGEDVTWEGEGEVGGRGRRDQGKEGRERSVKQKEGEIGNVLITHQSGG